MNRWHAFTQLVLVRWREFHREPETIFWGYFFPLLLALGLGVAFGGSQRESPVVDIQRTEAATAVEKLHRLLSAEGMTVAIHDEAECRRRLRSGKTTLVVAPQQDGLTFVFDPARSESLTARYWVEAAWLRKPDGQGNISRDDIVQDPGNRYIDFLLPGLIGINLMGGGLFSVGFVVVDMRVRKLFKRLLATPMRRGDFLISILVARMTFLIPEIIILLLFGWFVFGVPIYGDPLALALTILCGALAFNGLGLLVGCRTEKTETISGLINLVMLPMYLLSGVFFSSKRFPDAVQPFIQALPLTQINDALREVMLEGGGLSEVGWRLGILVLWAGVTFALALKWFRWR